MTESPLKSDWTECRGGELVSLGERLRTEHRQQQVRSALRVAAPVAAVMVILAATAVLWVPSELPHGGITCAECFQQFDAYHAHLQGTVAMEEQRAQSMQLHLAECERCRASFDKRFPGLVSALWHRAGAVAVASRQPASLPIAGLSQLPALRAIAR